MGSLSLPKEEMDGLLKSANAFFEEDLKKYNASHKSGSKKGDFEWMNKLMKAGTLPDRMAAFIVRIQDSPIHNLNLLSQLIMMVKVQGKQQCVMTADTLRDLFLEDLLPPDRKLVPFEHRGVELRTATKKQLIEWVFEDKLKVMYASYIEALRRMMGDTVEKIRGKGISIVHRLIVKHPEQEEVLLPLLVNKLGDPSKKMASRALFLLKTLLDEHPRMKMVVVEEVERLLFRNNIAKRAQYYGICFLNVVDTREEHASLAHKLTTVYIAFFKSSVKTGNIDTKMMSGLLTGINRTFPKAREFGFKFTENLDTLYKIVQLSQFTIATQALCVLFQILDVGGNQEGADRFYRVLYQKLTAPEFASSAHNGQFINVVFKALKADNDINRITGFTKRLLQICQGCQANLACAILFLISEVAKVHPTCIKLGTTSKIELKEDSDCISESDEEEETERQKQRDMEKLMKTTNIKMSSETDPHRKMKTPIARETMLPKLSSSCSDADVEAEVKEEKVEDVDKKKDYDPSARNPRYCGAETTLTYELNALGNHFHPSVAMFAQSLIQKQSIKYDGNPIRDFTLTRFLERFSYRNPKENKEKRCYKPKGLRGVPVNSETYRSAEEGNIPVDEMFFYRYFKSTQSKRKVAKNEDEEDVSDVESIGDDEFDSLMSNYFKSTTPVDDSEEEDDLSSATGVDFASGLHDNRGKKGKRKKEDSDSEQEEDDDPDFDEEGEDDDGDDFVDLDADEMADDEDDLDDTDMFDADDDEAFRPIMKKKSMKKQKISSSSTYAPAEEFSEMLEDNVEDMLTGSHTLINKERADKKQMKWEANQIRKGQMNFQNSGKAKNKQFKRRK